MTPIDLKNCNLFLIDGTGANFISIRVGEGTLTYSTKREIQPRKSRGNLFQQREGEEQPTDISFQFVWDNITSSGIEVPTVEDVLYNTVGWVSANHQEDPNGPFCVNLQVVNTVPCYGGIPGQQIKETFNFPLFTWSELNHSLKDSTVDCKGTSNRTKPIIIRSQ